MLLAFSLYFWPSPYTVGLLPMLVAFSLYYSYTVGLLPILLTLLPIWLTLSLYSSVSRLSMLLAFSLYCLLALSLYYFLYSWPSPYTIGLYSISVPLFTMCIADLWDTHTTHVHGHFQQVTHAQLQCGHSM